MKQFVVIPAFWTRAGLRPLGKTFGPFNGWREANNFAMKYREALKIIGEDNKGYFTHICRILPPQI